MWRFSSREEIWLFDRHRGRCCVGAVVLALETPPEYGEFFDADENNFLGQTYAIIDFKMPGPVNSLQLSYRKPSRSKLGS